MPNSDDVLIKVENVSKKFCRSLKRSMLYGMEDISRDLLHLPNTSDKLRKDEFWAVDDVSFEVKRGECLGIIGRNGAGKSTLLKMLNGIILPDKGKISIKGKVGALIEVGAGFHPMLTGRENVYVNGAILGMSKREIDKKFDEIVAFAELEEFIDMPVKHYSSGMYVRLGFGIAAQMTPDILIVDEVLAVGDANFRAKCLNQIRQFINNNCIILVSHNMHDINRVANKAILLQKGVIKPLNTVSDCIATYEIICMDNPNDNFINKELLEIYSLRIKHNPIPIKSKLKIMIEIGFKDDFENVLFGYSINNKDDINIIKDSFEIKTIKHDSKIIELEWNEFNLSQGSYWFGLFIWANNRRLQLYENLHMSTITITDQELDTTKRDGIIFFPAEFRIF